MKYFLTFFLYFYIQCFGSLLTSHIHDIKLEPTSSLKVFGLAFSDGCDFSYLSTELKKYGMHLQIIDCVREKTLSQDLKKRYCSKNTSPYLVAQIFAHLNAYRHCIDHRIPLALMLEKNAFLYANPSELFPSVNELETHIPDWDILFTDVHYHMPKDGSLVAPQVVVRGKRFPTHTKVSKHISKVICRYGTVAFVISESGMRKILEFYTHHWLDLPFDQALFKIPNLKIFSVNQDIITNEHRCPKYDQWQKERIAASSKYTKSNSENILSVGKQFIQPQTILTPQNWTLIQSYVRQKFASIAEKCSWIQELQQALPSEGLEQAVVLSATGKILSGVEEVAQALVSNRPIEVTVIDRFDRDFEQFPLNQKRSLSAEQKDFLAYQYIQLFPDHYIACLFPCAEGLDTLAEHILKQHGCILYKKEIHMNSAGALEFIRLIYPRENWVGNQENDFKLGRIKAQNCFPSHLINRSPLRIYLYYSPSLDQVKEAKTEIRKLYQCSNDSIHINDYYMQAKLIGATVFNKQSLSFLNHRLSSTKVPNFEWLLSRFQLALIEKKLPSDHCCVDSSGVLAAYGLRDCLDLDVLHDSSFSPKAVEGVDSHNSYLKFYPLLLEEILWNPNHHFYLNGIKFVSLDLTRKMKKNRREAKDLKDIKLIASLDD